MLNESAFAAGLADGLEKTGMGLRGQQAIWGASAGALAGVLSSLITPGSFSRKVKRALTAGAVGAAIGAGVSVGGGAIGDRIVNWIDRGSGAVDSTKKYWRGREV